MTLDLAGFVITGEALPPTPITECSHTPCAGGIVTELVDHHGIHVHSGTVANFPGAGVELIGNGHTIGHIRAIKNQLTGIFVDSLTGPNGHRIIGNAAISNGSGIFVFCPSVVLENTAAGNGTGTPAEQIFELPGHTPGTCTNRENSPNVP